jgi:hypothetical protein
MCCRPAIELASALHVNKPCACRCERAAGITRALVCQNAFGAGNSLPDAEFGFIEARELILYMTGQHRWAKCHDKVKYKPTAQLSWGRFLFSCPFPLLSLIRYSLFAASARLQEERT